MRIIDASYEIDHFEPEEDIRRIAKAARICYKFPELKSFEEQKALVRRLRDRDPKHPHHSPLEHSSLSVDFIINRGISHELVRHRHTAYSQESTRYCNYAKNRFNNEIIFIKDSASFESAVNDIWMDGLARAEEEYFKRLSAGQKPEEARGCLPNDLKTELYVTTNFREWRNIFNLRCDSHAHYQMREIMIPLFKELCDELPCVFDDIKLES